MPLQSGRSGARRLLLCNGAPFRARSVNIPQSNPRMPHLVRRPRSPRAGTAAAPRRRSRPPRCSPRMVLREIAVRAQVFDIPRTELVRQRRLDELGRATIRGAKVVPCGGHDGAAGRAADVAALREPQALVSGAGTALATPVIPVRVGDVARVNIVEVVARRRERQPAVPGSAREQRGEQEGVGPGHDKWRRRYLRHSVV